MVDIGVMGVMLDIGGSEGGKAARCVRRLDFFDGDATIMSGARLQNGSTWL